MAAGAGGLPVSCWGAGTRGFPVSCWGAEAGDSLSHAGVLGLGTPCLMLGCWG